MIAVRLLLDEKKGPTEVARLLGVTRSAVNQWQQALRRKGRNALKAKRHPGATPRLTRPQRRKLLRILLRGPCRAGFPTDLWTCPRVATVIQEQFGVTYHPAHVWRLLRKLAWSCQKPEQRARERDEAEIERWRREEWPRIKKGRAS
jgi:transposase